MGNFTPKNIEPGFEVSAEEKISQLLSAMPRVEAPGDFGFRVKARIAEVRPVNSRPLWLPTALKAAVPLGLALAIGGYVGVTSLYVNDTPSVGQAVSEPARPGLVQSVPAATNPEAIALPEVAVSTQESTSSKVSSPVRDVATKKVSTRRPVTPKPASDDKASGSYIIAASETKSLLSQGDPVVKPETTIKGTPAGEILTKIGVNALFGEGGWKADSVSPNTAAAKAGVKAGDIIESVDGQDMSDRASVAKPATGKKLKVKRDGKSVEIVID
jgi:membrane-associated protease RseP (regulator of RpoE activity)